MPDERTGRRRGKATWLGTQHHEQQTKPTPGHSDNNRNQTEGGKEGKEALECEAKPPGMDFEREGPCHRAAWWNALIRTHRHSAARERHPATAMPVGMTQVYDG